MKNQAISRFIVKVVVALVILSLSILGTAATKNNKLDVLAFIQATGSEPRIGRACKTAMQIAVDAVNARDDILPNHLVTITYKDEGAVGNYAPRTIIEFARSYENINLTTQFENSTIQSPIIIGPYFSCQNVARAVTQLNFIQFTHGCGASLFTANRKAFPNLYRWRQPSEATTLGKLFFASRVGQWKQIAIITPGSSPNEFKATLASAPLYLKEGFTIVALLAISNADADDYLISLKAVNARVIFMESIQLDFVLKFLCRAYQNGIQAPNFVVIASASVFIDPNAFPVPNGCTKQQIIEQLRLLFYIGNFNIAIQNVVNTTLGYDLAGFEARFNAMSGKDYPLDADFRHLCHDAMALGLLALHRTEALLNSQNKTLAYFQAEPEVVMQAANKSASQSIYKGLRVDATKYSDRLELDSESIWIFQNSRDLKNPIRLLYKISYTGNGSTTAASSYVMQQVNDPVWPSGKNPPKDLSLISVINITLPHWLYPSAIALSVLGSVGIFICILIIWRNNSYSNDDYKKYLQIGNGFLGTGSFLLDGAAILFTVNESREICEAKYTLLCVGLSFIEAALAIRISNISKLTSKQRLKAVNTLSRITATKLNATFFSTRTSKTKVATATSSVSTTITSSSLREPLRAHTDKILISVAVNIMANSLIFVVWLGIIDPISIVEFYSAIDFDLVNDNYFTIKQAQCSCRFETAWIGTLVALHSLNSLTILFLIYKNKFRTKGLGREYYADFQAVRIATANAVVLFFGIIAVTVVVAPIGWIAQSIVVTFGILLYSISTSITFCMPTLARILKTEVPVQ